MKQAITAGLLLLLLQGCSSGSKTTEQAEAGVSTSVDASRPMVDLSELAEVVDGDMAEGYEEREYAEEERGVQETRLRFPNFTLVFHNFRGYSVEDEENGSRRYYGQFGGGSDYGEAVLNDHERYIKDQYGDETENPNYTEALLVKKDTVRLSEELFDERINNTLIEIIPKNRKDRFRVSAAYLSNLSEVFDDSGLSQEVLEKMYQNLERVRETTAYHSIRDSAHFFFRAMPHTSDMVEVTVADGKVVPVKMNTQEQLDNERKQYENELKRIRNKYGLRDTLVYFEGEGGGMTAIFTKNKKLYAYEYEAFLFRIERLSLGKPVETKYVVVYIGYGC